jgi:hypothetical protein
MKKLELGSWLIVTCRVRTLNRAVLGMRATHMHSRSCAWDPNSQNIPIQGPYMAKRTGRILFHKQMAVIHLSGYEKLYP